MPAQLQPLLSAWLDKQMSGFSLWVDRQLQQEDWRPLGAEQVAVCVSVGWSGVWTLMVCVPLHALGCLSLVLAHRCANTDICCVLSTITLAVLCFTIPHSHNSTHSYKLILQPHSASARELRRIAMESLEALFGLQLPLPPATVRQYMQGIAGMMIR